MSESGRGARACEPNNQAAETTQRASRYPRTLDTLASRSIASHDTTHAPRCRLGRTDARQGEARLYSDLDIVIRARRPLEFDRLGELWAAFSGSDLPIKVDVLDWAGIDNAFRKSRASLEPLYP